MKNYSIIEGCIRQSTNNPINKNTNESKSNDNGSVRKVRRDSAEHGE